jgi:hypothetical protein
MFFCSEVPPVAAFLSGTAGAPAAKRLALIHPPHSLARNRRPPSASMDAAGFF